jgi:putative redox protein
MATSNRHRSVTVERTARGRFTILNARDATHRDRYRRRRQLHADRAAARRDRRLHRDRRRRPDSRRSEPGTFEIRVDADKVRDDNGNRLTDIVVTFDVRFPDGEAGDAARAVLPEPIARSHDRLCTVGRTVELGTAMGDGFGGGVADPELPRRRPARISKPFATRHSWLRLSPVTNPDRPSVVSGVGVAVTPPSRHPKCDSGHDMARKPRNPTQSVSVSEVGVVVSEGGLERSLHPYHPASSPGP